MYILCVENRRCAEITFLSGWKQRIPQPPAKRLPWKIRCHGYLPLLTFTQADAQSTASPDMKTSDKGTVQIGWLP